MRPVAVSSCAVLRRARRSGGGGSPAPLPREGNENPPFVEPQALRAGIVPWLPLAEQPSDEAATGPWAGWLNRMPFARGHGECWEDPPTRSMRLRRHAASALPQEPPDA